VAQFINHLRCLRPDVVAQNNSPEQITPRDPDFGSAGSGLDRRQIFIAREFRPTFNPVAFADENCRAAMLRLQTLAGDRFKLRKFDGHQIFLFAVARDGAGERMRG
jgi:hypothetical protein